MSFEHSGVVVIDKPSGWTSHQMVSRARRVFGTRKIGHAGTLDPMATGVLILGVNRATRLLGHLALHDKAYQATIRLGVATNTDDADGEVISTSDASLVDLAKVNAEIAKLTGDIWQRPSAVSAIKVNGQRAYALVRKGHAVELPARQVNVSRFEVVSAKVTNQMLDLAVEVECSSGTYVRALARDLGISLGLGGHLISLRRTRIGKYSLSLCQTLALEQPPSLMRMAEAAELSFDCCQVTEADAENVRYGRPLARCITSNPTGIIGPDGELIALYRPDADRALPVAVLISAG